MSINYKPEMIVPLIIAYCERDAEHAALVFNHFKEKHIGGGGPWTVFRHYKELYDEAGELPNRELLKAMVHDTQRTEEQVNEFIQAMDTISLDAWPAHQVRQLTAAYYKRLQLMELMEGAMGILDTENSLDPLVLDRTESLLKDGLILNKPLDDTRPTDYDADFDGFLDTVLTKDSRKVVKTGYAKLDNDGLKGGLPESTLTVLASRTHGGKTATMLNMAHRQVHNGYNVLFVTLEDTKLSCDYRELALRSDIPLEILQSVKIADKKRPVNEFRERHKKASDKRGKYYIVDMGEKEFRVSDLRRLVAGFGEGKLDAVYIDYIGKIAPPKELNSSSMYEKAKSIAAELRRVALEYKLPIITAAQTTRESIRKTTQDLDLDCISESYAIAHSADLIIILSGQSDADRIYEHQRYIKIVKNRISGIVEVMFNMYWDKKTLKIFDHSQHDHWLEYAAVTGDSRKELHPNGKWEEARPVDIKKTIKSEEIQ